MKNKEKYKDKIFEIATSGDRVAIVNGKPVKCSGVSFCDKCDFNMGNCRAECARWMESDNVDWSKVPVDTKILVKDVDCQRWMPKYFAKYENQTVYAWGGGSTSYSAGGVITGWRQAMLYDESEVNHDE